MFVNEAVLDEHSVQGGEEIEPVPAGIYPVIYN